MALSLAKKIRDMSTGLTLIEEIERTNAVMVCSQQQRAGVKNKRSGLNIFLFSLLIFISFLIYFSLFLLLELGLGLE